MKNRRIPALLLALLMIAPSAISCSETTTDTAEETQPSAEVTAEEAAVEEEPEEDARLECSVPADVTLGGEAIGILSFRDDAVNTYISVTETTGELFNDAN